MPRVTQDFDFQIHEDSSSIASTMPMDEHGPQNDEPESAESSFVDDNVDDVRGHEEHEEHEEQEEQEVHEVQEVQEVQEEQEEQEEHEEHEEHEEQEKHEEHEEHEENGEDGRESNIGIMESVEKDNAEVSSLSIVDDDRDDAEGEKPQEIDDSLVSHEEDEDATPAATQLGDNESVSDAASRRDSAVTDRRTSGRTEALIHAAARAVVAQIEEHRRSAGEEEDHDADNSIVSHTTDDTHGVDGTELSYTTQSEASPRESDVYTQSEASPRPSDIYTLSESSRRQSSVHANPELGRRRDSLDSHSTLANKNEEGPRVSEGHRLPAPSDDAGGDSSSHHEADDDDVFSDRSPRSSLGSVSSDPDRKHRSLDDTLTQATRSPRLSEISQYEKADFVPTIRGTPRIPFRTPSDVRAMQMASPPASVYGSPRSSKRPPLPTISRLGSPSVSAQYSPKRKSTPPRFKSRKEPAPLVLLHATLLPSRWPWANVLEVAETDNLSDPAKTLRDNWRQLQDRIGDTVLERGVLIPHPQNDFEILEERLLDAMDLPLRRRARILECGHYLGPSNEKTLSEDMDSDDEDLDDTLRDTDRKTHWCTTCRHEIKYDSLGPGKVFRVKVYASNGLMKAGAWEACWKEMERVDVEIEPIVEPSLAQELGHLAAEQQKQEEEAERMVAQQLSGHRGSSPPVEQHMEDDGMANQVEPDTGEVRYVEDHDHSMTNHQGSPQILSSPSSPHIHIESPRVDTERRTRDEEHLRGIYGHTSPTPHSRTRQSARASSMSRHPDSYIPPPSPPSPSEEAYARRRTRRRPYQTASLPELLLEALKVVMQDRKNVVIAFLTFLAMLLAVRGGGPREEPHNHFPVASMQKEIPTVVTTVVKPVETVETVETAETVEMVESAVSSMTTSVATSAEASQPCESSKGEAPKVHSEIVEKETEIETETVTSREIVRVFETVTETLKVTATATIISQQQDIEEKLMVKAMDMDQDAALPAEEPVMIVADEPSDVNRDEL